MRFKLQFDMFLCKTINSTPMLVCSPEIGRTDFWDGVHDHRCRKLARRGLRRNLKFDHEGSSFYAHTFPFDRETLFCKGEKGFAVLEGEWWDGEDLISVIELDTNELNEIAELSLLGEDIYIIDSSLNSSDLPAEKDLDMLGPQTISVECKSKSLAWYELEDDDSDRYGSFFIWHE